MNTANPEFVLTRTFDAPRDLIFRVWTEPDHLARWFGPKGTSIVKADMDLRPGGSYHYGLGMPDGKVMWGLWNFVEVQSPEKIVLVQHFSDEKRGVTRHPFAPDWPLKTLSSTTLTKVNGKTLLKLVWAPFEATELEKKTFADGMAGMEQGWGGTMEQLVAYLATIQG